MVLARGEERVGGLKVNYQPQTVTAHPTLPELVVGGKVRALCVCVGRERDRERALCCVLQDNSVHVYTLSGDTLTEKKSFQAGQEVVAAEFSPDGATLAISSGRSVLLYDSTSYEVSPPLSLSHTHK